MLHIVMSNSRFWIEQELLSYPNSIYIDSITKKLSESSRLFLNFQNTFYTIDDNEFIGNKSAWDKAKNSLNTFILFISNIDKRSSFYKTLKGEFKEIKEDLQKTSDILSKKLNLSKLNVLRLLEYYNNVDQTILELDKIKRLNYNEYSIDWLFDNNIISPTKNFDIFNFSKAIGKKDKKTLIKLLKNWDNQNIIPLLAVIFNDFKVALQLKTCNLNNAYKIGGINNWDAKRVYSFGNPYSREQLYDLISLCSELDQDIKFGKLTMEEASIYLFSEILSK